MYSFHPLASIPVEHFGFGLLCFMCVCWLIIAFFNEPETFFFLFFVATIVCGIGYGVSYHWTNQEPKTFVNTPVVGEFVGYQPEGYNERSGKSRAGHHYMYVVYSVNGNLVILNAQAGAEYPKQAQLYKN